MTTSTVRQTSFKHIVLTVFLLCLSGLASANTEFNAKTTEACKIMVNALEKISAKYRAAELLGCESIDRRRQDHRISLANSRLQSALANLKAGQVLSLRSQQEIYADQIDIRSYPDSPIKTSYQLEFQEYLLKASANNGKLAPLAKQADSYLRRCSDFYQALQDLKDQHQQSLLSLLQAKASSKSETSPELLQLDEQRKKLKSLLQQHIAKAQPLLCLYPSPAAPAIAEAEAETGMLDIPKEMNGFTAKGNLRNIGNYLWRSEGSVVTPLANGKILVYGAGLNQDYWEDYRYQYQQLQRHLREGRYDMLKKQPVLWEPEKKAWIKLAPAPECPQHGRSLHTTTVINQDQILLAGGVCQAGENQVQGDRVVASQSFSLFDTQTRKWLTAPSSDQARIYHSANLLADGSVIIIAGLDPEQIHAEAQPVLNSVQLYSKGELQQLPPLQQARARHSTVVLADGRVVVSGGFDQQGQPLASSEIWSPGAKTWRLLKPMQQGRYNHSISVLKDGSVMVAGGWGQDYQPLNSVELLDLNSETWSAGPELPVKLHGHSAIVQADGEVILVGGAWLEPISRELPWAWSWDQKSMDWRAIAITQAANRASLSSGFSLLGKANGELKIFAKNGIFLWNPASNSKTSAIPRWRENPSVKLLANGQAIWIGIEYGDDANQRPVSYLYNPANKSWTFHGNLHRPNWSNRASIELPDQSIMHVSVDADVLQCEIWQPAKPVWQDCGYAQTEYLSHSPLELGLLKDGRVFAITNMHEALVYDAANNLWQPWQIKWHEKTLELGVAMPLKTPFFTLYDEEAASWLAHNQAGANFWMRGRTADRERLLLSPKGEQWIYALHAYKAIGRDAQLLPDGCALSTNPMAIFNPNTGKAELISGPLAAKIPAYGTLQVYPDGSFTIAKSTQNESEQGLAFFSGQASCAGITAETQAEEVFGELMDEPKAIPQAVQTPALQFNLNSLRHAILEPVLAVVRKYSWVMIIVIVLALAIFIVKKMGLQKTRVNTSKNFRILIYGAVIFYAITVATRHWRAQQVEERLESNCDLDIKACVDKKTGLLKASKQAQSTIPFRLVGSWTYRRFGIQRRLQLKDDGSYSAESVQGSIDEGKIYQGLWARQGNAIAWRHQQGGTEIELNPLELRDQRSFVLTETDGTKTLFELNQAADSTRCSQD